MSPRRFFSFLAPFIPITPLALAAEAGTGAAPPELGSSVLQMLFGLMLVLALLLGILWLLKRFGQAQGGNGLIRVVAGVAVGPRERVVVLELGGSWLVLGVAPGQVSTLAEIPPQEIPSPPATKDFSAWLRQALHHRNHA